MSRLFRKLRSGSRTERGQVLLLFAAGLAGFMGVVGMSIDVGQIMYTRTDLQKIADAAALAGSQDLPNAGQAMTTANTYVSRNGGASCQPNCATVSNTNDLITVTATRHVSFTLLRAIGMSGVDVKAKAAVKSFVATGFAFNNPAVFPYAVWGGNASYPNGCTAPYGICNGLKKTYRSNQWDNQVDNQNKTNGNWTVPGNNFKGFFNTTANQQQVYQSSLYNMYSFGGNAMGKEPVDALHQAYINKTPITVPVITKGTCTNNCGTLNFKIVGWVCLLLDNDPASAGNAWTGTVTTGCVTPDGSGGGYDPGGSYPPVRSTTMIE